MSSRKKAFRRTITQRYELKRGITYGLFRYGRLMDVRYAKGYCCNHNCLLCSKDLKCKHCRQCKHFTTSLVNAI